MLLTTLVNQVQFSANLQCMWNIHKLGEKEYFLLHVCRHPMFSDRLQGWNVRPPFWYNTGQATTQLRVGSENLLISTSWGFKPRTPRHKTNFSCALQAVWWFISCASACVVMVCAFTRVKNIWKGNWTTQFHYILAAIVHFYDVDKLELRSSFVRVLRFTVIMSCVELRRTACYILRRMRKSR